jgi:carbon storage regulator CsrA
MLVLSRKPGESIVITVGDSRVEFTITEIRGVNVRIAFDAPPNARINRKEVEERRDIGLQARKAVK